MFDQNLLEDTAQLTIGSFNLSSSIDVSQIHNPSIMKLFSIFFSHWNFYPTEFTLKRYFLDTFRWLSGQKDQKSRLTDQKQQRESDVGRSVVRWSKTIT